MAGRKIQLQYPDDGIRDHAAMLAEALPDAVQAVIDLLRSKDPDLKKQKAEVALKILSSLNVFDTLKSVFAEKTTSKVVENLTKQFQETLRNSQSINSSDG